MHLRRRLLLLALVLYPGALWSFDVVLVHCGLGDAIGSIALDVVFLVVIFMVPKLLAIVALVLVALVVIDVLVARMPIWLRMFVLAVAVIVETSLVLVYAANDRVDFPHDDLTGRCILSTL